GTAVLKGSDRKESGKLVIVAEHLVKTYGERVLVKDFSTRIQRGNCVGFVGPNGVGKTTLLSMLTGLLAPDSGFIRLGTNLEIAVLDQKRDSLNLEQTLSDYLTDGRGENVIVNGEQRHVASYMKDFLFQPEQLRTPIRELSGGERARLMLARVLARPANLLVLDEPTNDLDMETLDLLQELVSGFAGTVLLVSHDRDFLDRTVTSVIAPEGDGRWLEYAGGYTDMLAQRKEAALATRKELKTAKPQTSADASSEKPAAQREEKRKLSYKQKFALENLPGKMEVLHADIHKLEAKLADPNLFAKNPQLFNKTVEEIGKKRHDLERFEEEWLELEMLREEIGG
ncbi:MAG: ATP-binding cassette domain-containing protein, partial [Pyrinomonadaceae bacterium]